LLENKYEDDRDEEDYMEDVKEVGLNLFVGGVRDLWG